MRISKNKKKKNVQIAWDDAQRLAKRRMEREKGRNDAHDDLSELSEGEKEKGEVMNQMETTSTTLTANLGRINSEMNMWSDETSSSKQHYIVLIRFDYFINVTPPLISVMFYLYHKLLLSRSNVTFTCLYSIVYVVFMDWYEERIWNWDEILTLVVRY